MPCSLQALLYREKNNLCITCAQPAAWLEREQRHGKYCARHRKANIDNFKKWKERTRNRPRPQI